MSNVCCPQTRIQDQSTGELYKKYEHNTEIQRLIMPLFLLQLLSPNHKARTVGFLQRLVRQLYVLHLCSPDCKVLSFIFIRRKVGLIQRLIKRTFVHHLHSLIHSTLPSIFIIRCLQHNARARTQTFNWIVYVSSNFLRHSPQHIFWVTCIACARTYTH